MEHTLGAAWCKSWWSCTFQHCPFLLFLGVLYFELFYKANFIRIFLNLRKQLVDWKPYKFSTWLCFLVIWQYILAVSCSDFQESRTWGELLTPSGECPTPCFWEAVGFWGNTWWRWALWSQLARICCIPCQYDCLCLLQTLCPQSWPEECYPGRALLVINW